MHHQPAINKILSSKSRMMLVMIRLLGQSTFDSTDDTSTRHQGLVLINSGDQRKFKMWLKTRKQSGNPNEEALSSSPEGSKDPKS